MLLRTVVELRYVVGDAHKSIKQDEIFVLTRAENVTT